MCAGEVFIRSALSMPVFLLSFIDSSGYALMTRPTKGDLSLFSRVPLAQHCVNVGDSSFIR